MSRYAQGQSRYTGKDYSTIEAALSAAGFKNFRGVPLNDVIIGLRKKTGMVEFVTVNGHIIPCVVGE